MMRHWLLLFVGGLLCFLLESNSVWAFHSWQRVQLSNGLTLLIVEKPHTPVVSMTLLVKGGTSTELPSQKGVSSLTVQALTQGTRQRSGDQIAESIADLGGAFGAEAHFDFTTLDWVVLKEDLVSTLEVLADVVRQPVFPQKEGERKWQAKASITPDMVLQHYFFNSAPYRLPAPGEAVDSRPVERHDVVQFHQQVYRPQNIILAAVGAITLQEVQPLVEKYFGDWTASAKAEQSPPVLSMNKKPGVLIIDRSLTQARVRLAFVGAPATSPDTPALLLLSHLLTNSPKGELQQNLREEKQWTYHVWSEVEAFQQAGLFVIGMSVPYEMILPALEETGRELVRIQTEPVSEALLKRIKQQLTSRFYFETEDIRDISRFAVKHEAYTQGQASPAAVLKALRQVTVNDIKRAARTYLDHHGAVVAIEGDATMLWQHAPTLSQRQLPRWSSPPGVKVQPRENLQTPATTGEQAQAIRERIVR